MPRTKQTTPAANTTQYYTYGVDLTQQPYNLTAVPVPREGNKLYPLPPMFNKLSPQEQSWWRVNACCIQRTPQEFTEAYAFFFRTYLWPKEAGFLEDRRTPPPFHYRIVHDIAAYHFNVFGAPRHSCKTVLLRGIFLLLMLTRRNYRSGYLTSKQKKYREGVNAIRKQITNNRLITADFGDRSPHRGGESWNSDEIELIAPYSCRLTGMSLDGKERGWHGEFLGIDDAEKDPDTDEVIPEYVRKLETKLLYVYMPMVEIMPEDLYRPEINRVGRGVCLMGTVLGEDMVLNKVITAEPGGPYDAWNKWKFEQETMGLYLWPERWGKRSSEIQRRVLGDDAFDAEKQNRPGKSKAGAWKIHPLYHAYHTDSVDGKLSHDPWNSNDIIRWAVREGNESHTWLSLTAREWVSSMTIGILVDTHKIRDPGRAKSVTSDFTVAHVFGNDQNSMLWSLDIRRGRFDSDEALNAIFDLCFKWKPTFIAIESCGLYARIADELMLRLQDQMISALGWVPYPKDLGVFNKITEDKGRRIERVSWRFRTHRIRFPWWRRNSDPYDQCWHEVENFTVDLSKLKYDDIVDTIGLTPYVFRGAGGRPISANPWDGRSVEELIISGQFITKDGYHLVDHIPSLSALSDEALKCLESYYHGRNKGDKTKIFKTVQSRPLLTL